MLRIEMMVKTHLSTGTLALIALTPSQLHLERSISKKSMDNSILRTSSAKQDELDKSVFSPKETGSVGRSYLPSMTRS